MEDMPEFVSVIPQIDEFLLVIRFPTISKTDCHDVTKILLEDDISYIYFW
jgi:hypothetical protein